MLRFSAWRGRRVASRRLEAMSEDEKAKRFVRFDFPPGAGPKEIAAAIEAARRRIVAEWARKQEERDDAQRGDGTGPEAG